MGWPQAPDYVEAVQNLTIGVRDPDLRQGMVVNNSAGLPSTRSGNFATVFQIRSADGTQTWALKCFTRGVSNLQRRYHAVDVHLQGHARLPFMVGFGYLSEGILVRGTWYSVVKMDWAEGQRLDEFLDDCLKRDNYQGRLETLARMWLRLARMLREARVGHGDLQHGNVILVPVPERNGFQLKLIDYDGMFVPALAEEPPSEIGHPAFQHPLRSSAQGYGAEVDRFSHLLIYWTLRCLSVGGRELWERYHNDDRLLVDRQDLLAPEQSAAFRELWGFPDPAVQCLTGHLMLAAKAPLDRVPLLNQLVMDSGVAPLNGRQQQQVEHWIHGRTVVRNGRAESTDGGSRPAAAAPVPAPPAAGPPVAPVVNPAADRTRRPAASGPARTTEQRLLEWIKAGTQPADFYELLGQSRCHPRREELFAAVRECNRVLHECQNHQDAQFADRAINFQRQVAEALNAFSDDRRWQEYDQQLVARWREQYAARNGQDPSRWRPEGLRRWLAMRQVHPARLDEIAGWMRQVPPPDEPTGTGTAAESAAEAAAEATPGPARPTSFRSTAFPREPAPRREKPPAAKRKKRSQPGGQQPQTTADTGSPTTPGPASDSPFRPPAAGGQPPDRVASTNRPARALATQTSVAPRTGGSTQNMWLWWMLGSVVASMVFSALIAVVVLVWLLR